MKPDTSIGCQHAVIEAVRSQSDDIIAHQCIACLTYWRVKACYGCGTVDVARGHYRQNCAHCGQAPGNVCGMTGICQACRANPAQAENYRQECEWCGDDYLPNRSLSGRKYSSHRFCSRRCYGEHLDDRTIVAGVWREART